MKGLVRYSLLVVSAVLSCAAALAQPDRREVRSGNRQFKKGNWQKSEIEYRKALVKDTSSVALNPIIKFTNLFGVLAMEIAISENFRAIAPYVGIAFVLIALYFVYRSFYKMRIK